MAASMYGSSKEYIARQQNRGIDYIRNFKL